MTTILHIDDDPDHRLIVEMVMQSMDPRIALVQAESAEAAQILLDGLLAVDGHAMVLSDHMMPGERGAVFAMRNLAACKSKGVPVWLLTSYPNDDEVMDAVAAGVDGVIDKPLDLGQFEQSLARVINAWLAQPAT